MLDQAGQFGGGPRNYRHFAGDPGKCFRLTAKPRQCCRSGVAGHAELLDHDVQRGRLMHDEPR
jgi:hypothetical protein